MGNDFLPICLLLDIYEGAVGLFGSEKYSGIILYLITINILK